MRDYYELSEHEQQVREIQANETNIAILVEGLERIAGTSHLANVRTLNRARSVAREYLELVERL